MGKSRVREENNVYTSSTTGLCEGWLHVSSSSVTNAKPHDRSETAKSSPDSHKYRFRPHHDNHFFFYMSFSLSCDCLVDQNTCHMCTRVVGCSGYARGGQFHHRRLQTRNEGCLHAPSSSVTDAKPDERSQTPWTPSGSPSARRIRTSRQNGNPGEDQGPLHVDRNDETRKDRSELVEEEI